MILSGTVLAVQLELAIIPVLQNHGKAVGDNAETQIELLAQGYKHVSFLFGPAGAASEFIQLGVVVLAARGVFDDFGARIESYEPILRGFACFLRFESVGEGPFLPFEILSALFERSAIDPLGHGFCLFGNLFLSLACAMHRPLTSFVIHTQDLLAEVLWLPVAVGKMRRGDMWHHVMAAQEFRQVTGLLLVLIVLGNARTVVMRIDRLLIHISFFGKCGAHAF